MLIMGTFFSPRIFNRRFKERSDWQIFSADLSRHDAGFWAFHCVKCGSEHSKQIQQTDTAQRREYHCNRMKKFFVPVFPLRVPAKAKNVPAPMA